MFNLAQLLSVSDFPLSRLTADSWEDVIAHIRSKLSQPSSPTSGSGVGLLQLQLRTTLLTKARNFWMSGARRVSIGRRFGLPQNNSVDSANASRLSGASGDGGTRLHGSAVSGAAQAAAALHLLEGQPSLENMLAAMRLIAAEKTTAASTAVEEARVSVDVRNQGASFLVIIRPLKTVGHALYRLRNETAYHTLFYRQADCEEHDWQELGPCKDTDYTWEEPTRRKKLLVRLKDTSSSVVRATGVGGARKYFGSTRFFGQTSEAANQVRNF